MHGGEETIRKCGRVFAPASPCEELAVTLMGSVTTGH